MTDNLLERLRGPDVFFMDGFMVSPVGYEAADRIEELEALVVQLLAKNSLSSHDDEEQSDHVDQLEEYRSNIIALRFALNHIADILESCAATQPQETSWTRYCLSLVDKSRDLTEDIDV